MPALVGAHAEPVARLPLPVVRLPDRPLRLAGEVEEDVPAAAEVAPDPDDVVAVDERERIARPRRRRLRRVLEPELVRVTRVSGLVAEGNAIGDVVPELEDHPEVRREREVIR